MSAPATPIFSADEERAVRAHAAAVARRNRPASLLLAAGAAVVVALVFAGLSVSRARSAQRAVESAAATRAAVQSVVDQIEALRAESASARTDGRYSRRLQLSTLAAINQRVGLDTPPVLQQNPPRSSGPDSPIEKRIVSVTMVNAPLAAALRWIGEAQRAIPGLFVTAIELRPTPAGWTVRVQVARWELKR
ncbi:MAG: hypothetical protein D6693_04205 [Planctomycetota bacterium]|nr:MAG: hypothetical protein D6693_04205 [Planctomycetota bacterium]